LGDRERMISKANPNVYELYKKLIQYFDKEVKDIPGIEAIEVSKIIHKAITVLNPKAKYLIGPGARKMSVLGRFPAKIRDRLLFKAIYQ
jgi:hypothetical protein